MKNLETLAADKESYDKESQVFIDSLRFVEQEIGEINSMKATQGWKILERKTREELAQRINELVKDDPKVSVLLALLTVADTKSQSKALEEEIAKILPQSG